MRDVELSTFCIVPHLLLQLVLLPVVQPLGLGLEPGVDLVLGAEALVDVPRLVDEVEHDLVLDAPR